MEWLEQNLDAYRIVGEILNELRATLQDGLREIHGAQWYRAGLPTEVFDRLVSTKEGETAIGWYEPEYQEIMDYAVFEDLRAILEHNRIHFPALVSIVPNPSLFNARFLELESLRRKIGRARPVSDAELTFLTRFLQRFRETLNEHRENGVHSLTPGDEVPDDQVPDDLTDEIKVDAPSAIPPATTGRTGAAPRPKTQTPVAPPPSAQPQAATAGALPLQRPAQRLQPVAAASPQPASGNGQAAEEVPSQEQLIPETLSAAIGNHDTKKILRELFREVTAVAESLWSTDVLPEPVVWKSVRTSNWYEVKYSPLGLKPLSDFYSVIAEVERRMASGLAKHELQALLEENNFAQVLLALRDMFQRNKI